MENKLKEYLGEKYSDNYVNNFLNYWMMPFVPREINDLDCIYLNGDLNADTLISPWTPTKWVLKCINPKEVFYKENKYGGDPFYFLKKLQRDIDKYLPKDDELVPLLYEFLKLAETRANVIRLPHPAMNCARYEKFYDEVPPMLFHVFSGGQLCHYFKSDAKVKEWIEEQRLQVAFNGDVRKENIRPLITNLPVDKAKWLENREEIAEALKEMIYLLSARFELFREEENSKIGAVAT